MQQAPRGWGWKPGANASALPAKGSAPFDPGAAWWGASSPPQALVHLLELGWAAVSAVSPPAPRSRSASPLTACVGSRFSLGANLQEIPPWTSSRPYNFKSFFKACVIVRFGAINMQKQLPQMKV